MRACPVILWYTVHMRLADIDGHLIAWLRRMFMPCSRVALFVVFFWFGALKLFEASPASPLVSALLEQTLPLVTFDQFIVVLGLLEMAIGLTFLFPGFERAAIALLIPHMAATALPLFLLPQITWAGWFAPTLEGQYILKNIIIIALAFGIAANLHPLKKQR